MCERCVWFDEEESLCENPSSEFFGEPVPAFFFCPNACWDNEIAIDELPVFFPIVPTRRTIDYFPDLLRLVPFCIAGILGVIWGVILFSLLGWLK